MLEVIPQVVLFLVATVAVLPAVNQARMLLLGTAAFYVAGAYTFAALMMTHTLSYNLALLSGGVGGATAAAAMGVLCGRLRGDYFALGTLCFAELLRLVLVIEPPFPGPGGISGIPRDRFLGIPLESQSMFVLVTIVALAAASALTALALRSPWGAALQAIRDNETAARTIGLPVYRLRLSALVYGGTWAGFAGALGACNSSIAEPESFGLTESIMVLVVILMAGRATVPICLLFGVVIGTTAEILRFFTSGPVRPLVFGAILILLAIAVRDELQGRHTVESRI